jgi:hypothetical protein
MADKTGPSPADGTGLPLKWHDNGDGTFSPVVFDAAGGGGGASGGTPALVLAATNLAGVATTFIREDDQIAVFDATVPTVSAVGDAAAVGTAAKAARRDHLHGREAFATPAIVLGAAAAAGVGTTPIRSDGTIAAFDATAPTTSLPGDAAAVGTVAFATRRDHKHARGTATRSLFFYKALLGLDSGTSGTIGAVPDALLTVALADAATQGLYAAFVVPPDYASGAINYVLWWIPGATDGTAHTVRWSTDVKGALVPGSDMSAAGTTTAFTGASAARTVNVLVKEAAQQALASATAGDVVKINVRRLGADAADTYVGVVNLAVLEIQYTANV